MRGRIASNVAVHSCWRSREVGCACITHAAASAQPEMNGRTKSRRTEQKCTSCKATVDMKAHRLQILLVSS